MEEIKEKFLVKFNHIISPDIVLTLEDSETMKINGKVKIAIDKMLGDFTMGLGLKSVVDKIVQKTVSSKGYFLYIRGIADASLSVENNKLLVRADYLPGKEWWAKPVALVVLGKLLGDFASNVENCGIYPGFRNEIKKGMQQLRKKNNAILDLRKLFIEQTFYTSSSKIFLETFSFNSVNTFSEDGNFIINFSGNSRVKRQAK